MKFRNRKKYSGSPIIIFLVISVLLHFLLIFVKIDVKGEYDSDKLVSIMFYDGDDIKAEKVEKIEPPEIKKEEVPGGQVVDIAKPKYEKKPDESRFVSEYDSSVEKETRSDFDRSITKRGEKLQKQIELEITGKEIDKEDRIIAGEKDKPVSEHLEKIKKGEFKGFDGTDGKFVKGEEKPEAGLLTGKDDEDEEGARYLGGRSIPRRFLPYLTGRDADLMSPSNDYLKDIDKSDETALNTKKYLYAAYFNKIKQAVSRHWTPAYVMMINDPQGHLYGRKNRYTKIIAMINANGTLASIELETSSGIDFLDREAINAFRMASPFQNPPEALLNEEGVMEIRFGFMVTME